MGRCNCSCCVQINSEQFCKLVFVFWNNSAYRIVSQKEMVNGAVSKKKSESVSKYFNNVFGIS